MAEENKKSILSDILNREKLQKAFQKDKIQEVKKASSVVKMKETTMGSSASQNSKDLYSKVETSKAVHSFDQTMEEMLIDIRYYFLKEGEYAQKFRKLYLDNKSNLDKYGIDIRRFFDYSRESFDRYKKTKNLMPLDPMKPKSFEYVEKSIKELIQLLASKFGK